MRLAVYQEQVVGGIAGPGSRKSLRLTLVEPVPCLMAWSRYIQDETGLVRYEGCDMGEIVPREKRAEEAVTAWSMYGKGQHELPHGGRAEGGEEEDKKPPGRTGQQEYYCKVTVGMGSLSMSGSRANGC